MSGTKVVKARGRRGLLVVHVGRMYKGGGYVADVWERTDMGSGGSRGHSTITTFEGFPGVWFGRVGTRRLPEWIDRIPGMGHRTLDRRIELVRRYHAQQARIAQLALAGNVPEGAQYSYDWHEARWDGDNGSRV